METWDETKRLSNLVKHGVDFRDLHALQWEDALFFEDRRRDYGELRKGALLVLKTRLHYVVFVERSGHRRIISARKANSREVDFYATKNLSSNPSRG